MNDPKSEDSEKSCENKSGGERENKQSEPFVCLYLTAATDEASVCRRKISGEEKRERERKGEPEEEEEERHFNDGWLTFASLARRASVLLLPASLEKLARVARMVQETKQRQLICKDMLSDSCKWG